MGVEIYINDNKELFAKFQSQKETIERFLELQIDCREADKACCIITLTDGDIKKGASSWNSLFDWLCETAIKFKEMVKKFDV